MPDKPQDQRPKPKDAPTATPEPARPSRDPGKPLQEGKWRDPGVPEWYSRDEAAKRK